MEMILSQKQKKMVQKIIISSERDKDILYLGKCKYFSNIRIIMFFFLQ